MAGLNRLIRVIFSASIPWLVAAVAAADAPQPWTLPQPTVLESRGIRMGGWLQQGITFNSRHTTDGYNGPVATNDWDGEYQMNQLWLYLSRPTNTGGCGWDWGGHIDLIYGTDWRYGVNYGLEDRINGAGQSYGLVMPQAYFEVAYNDLKVRAGHFAGILGYEAVPAVLNPFYSHSYAMGYTEPLLVTGVMADYQLTDRWLIQAGVHRGWMMWEDMNNSLDFMGGLKYTTDDQRSSLAYSVSVGPQDPGGNASRFASSLVWKRQFTEKFQYILQHNLGVEDGTGPGGSQAEWYGLNQFFLYSVTPKLTAGLRAEWLRDADGTRVAGVGNMPWAAGRAWDGAGYAGDFYEVTLGVQWRPRPNWLIRPEVRWDWYDGPDSALAGQERPFGGGNRSNQTTFATDVVFTY
ncbi:MAG: porin [Patescibacteria group bacterium]|nr:porin [Patescibacteria group bacterium]